MPQLARENLATWDPALYLRQRVYQLTCDRLLRGSCLLRLGLCLVLSLFPFLPGLDDGIVVLRDVLQSDGRRPRHPLRPPRCRAAHIFHYDYSESKLFKNPGILTCSWPWRSPRSPTSFPSCAEWLAWSPSREGRSGLNISCDLFYFLELKFKFISSTLCEYHPHLRHRRRLRLRRHARRPPLPRRRLPGGCRAQLCLLLRGLRVAKIIPLLSSVLLTTLRTSALNHIPAPDNFCPTYL